MIDKLLCHYVRQTFQLKRVPARTVREILELATAHRAELFEEWEWSQSDE